MSASSDHRGKGQRGPPAFLFALFCAACGASGKPRVTDDAAARFALNVTSVDTRFRTRDHFIASIEMQLSGEPFAEAMGRDVTGYARDYSCQRSVCTPDVYADPDAPPVDGGPAPPVIDVAGYSSAIESYEYSKQPMNNVAFESGAGTSLLFGPVIDPDGADGMDALAHTQALVERIAGATNASGRFVQVDDEHVLGWPGFWPTLQPFASFDPAIHPTNDSGCSLSSDDNAGAKAALASDEYECDYTSLHLPNRAAQTSRSIEPGASGFTDWKEALWTLNYLESMHDIHESSIDEVDESALSDVGKPGNTVGPGLHPGTYLGSSDIEGFQAGIFIEILDNQAAQWLASLTTADGATLGGFASVAAAIAYDESAPLRWFPGAIDVAETDDASGFPRPASYSIAEATSHLLDLAGLLGAYASAYALTDAHNTEVGGSQPARAYFDGDPFPAQGQAPTGAPTLHDRALAMMRVAVVDMERMHFDAHAEMLADDGAVLHGKATPGSILSTDVAAYALVALRTARRALDSELTLYGNTKPDAADVPCPLDAYPLAQEASFGKLLDRLIDSLATSLYDSLTAPDGTAFAGWALKANAPTDDGTSLDAHTAALRGLLSAYLSTGAVRYRDRAARVFARLEASFYDARARVYRAKAGDRGDRVTFTPRRFGLLQGALRDTYELIALLPGKEALRALVEDRVGRLDALVLDGWDDRNGDGRVQWPDECAHLGTGPDGAPLGLGGLQMAERTLTGETGSLDVQSADGGRLIATDRDHDCVPEISAVGLPAALASSITFSLTKLSVPPDGGLAEAGR